METVLTRATSTNSILCKRKWKCGEVKCLVQGNQLVSGTDSFKPIILEPMWFTSTPYCFATRKCFLNCKRLNKTKMLRMII